MAASMDVCSLNARVQLDQIEFTSKFGSHRQSLGTGQC